MAPNTLQLLKHVDPDWIRKRDPRRRLRETASRMKRKGLVEFKMVDGRKVMRLTEKGEREAKRLSLGLIHIPTPRKWDEKWRIIIFDIPEKRKTDRDKIRSILENLGFALLQNSVWVHPYDCEEIITLLKQHIRLGITLRYVIADAIEYDVPLRRHFGLPLER